MAFSLSSLPKPQYDTPHVAGAIVIAAIVLVAVMRRGFPTGH